MSREEAVRIEAQRIHTFAEYADVSWDIGDKKSAQRFERKSHYAYLAMVKLEGNS